MPRYINADLLLEDFKGRAKYADKWVNECSEEIKPRAEATRAFINEVIMTIQQAPSVAVKERLCPCCGTELYEYCFTCGYEGEKIEDVGED